MEFLPERTDEHLGVLNDRVRFCLLVEGILFRALDRMFEHVEEASQAGRFAVVDQPFTTAGDQHGSHVSFCLRQIKQLPTVFVTAHLDDLLARAITHIR